MSEAASHAGPDPVAYIQHHLTNACLGCDPKTHQPSNIIDFTVFFLDAFLWAMLLAGVFMLLAWRVGKNLNLERPGPLQNLIEAIVEFVNQQVKDIFPHAGPLVGPLALTIFVWVFLMNAMDLLPVDLLPWIATLVGEHMVGADPHNVYMKAVPTTNLDTTFGLALSVFGLIVYYNIKAKGLGGYGWQFLTHPFGIYLAPVNIVMTTVEEVAKPLSLGLQIGRAHV